VPNFQGSTTLPVQDPEHVAEEAVSGPRDPDAGADVARSLRRLGLDVRPLPEAGESTPAALQAAVRRHDRAVLFRGLADGWPACTAWAPSLLARNHGDKQVTALMGLPSTGVLFPQEQKRYERTLAFGEFLSSMLSASTEAPCYLAYKRAQEIFPPEDYEFAGLLGELNADADTRVWIGSAGTRSMLHSDLKDNLFCQVWGEKDVVLIPWQDSPAAYPFPDNIVNSQLDLAELDLERFPRLRETVLYASTVRPGDVLFMPRGWWHDIRARTPSVSVNHWFGQPLELRDYAGLLLKLGPRCWFATARDFVHSGLLGKREASTFFFSPPSTGKRLFDALRWGNFSRDNDPVSEER
jgi:lysine-specific demethylase 8